MSSIYSSTYLKNLSRNKGFQVYQRRATESYTARSSYDIFLSHSYLDKEEVEGLYIELTEFGFSVYVDWIVDPHIDRNNVTKETATLIRNRMKSCKTLLLAISENSSISKWMPWELGYMDGKTEKCAIIPVSRETYPQSSYRGFEYLSLYPFIKKVPNSDDINKLWIIEGAKKYVVFDDWLKYNIQPYERDIIIY